MMLRKWFLLSPAGTLLLLLGLTFQAVPWVQGTSTMVMPGGSRRIETTLHFGLPPSVQISTSDRGDGSAKQTSLEVQWHLLVPVLLGIYLVSAAVGRAITPPQRPWQPVKVMLTVLAIVFVVAFAVAMGWSRYYWGYFLARPAPDSRITDATRVVSYTPVQTEIQADGSPQFVPASLVYSILTDEERDEYYNLDERVPRILQARGLWPAERPRLDQAQLKPLYARLVNTGLLDFGTAGYSGAQELKGVVIGATGPVGEPLLFIAVTSGAVSNDHHAFYEFLFRDGDANGESAKLLSVRKFYYDVAGIEGMEWPLVLLALGIVGTLGAVPLTLIALGFRRWGEYRRDTMPGFPVAPT